MEKDGDAADAVCANFLDFTILFAHFCVLLHNFFVFFVYFCKILNFFAHFCTFMRNFAHVFCAYISSSKIVSVLFFSRFFQLCLMHVNA